MAKAIMIDCETWGLIPGAMIRSVGLVAFHTDGSEFEAGNPFTYEMYVNVQDPVPAYYTSRPASPAPPAPSVGGFGSAPPPQKGNVGWNNHDVSSHEGPNGSEFYRQQSTVDWWMKPENAEASKFLTMNREPVDMVLGRISQFFAMMKPDVVYAQGPVSDIVWLEYYYREYGYEIPWKYNAVRDTRTIYEAAGIERNNVETALNDAGVAFTPHYALDDARFQAYCVQAATWSIGMWRKGYETLLHSRQAYATEAGQDGPAIKE